MLHAMMSYNLEAIVNSMFVFLFAVQGTSSLSIPSIKIPSKDFCIVYYV